MGLIPLLVLAPTLSFANPYNSGFGHGVSDGNIANQGSSNWYILQPGKGFGHHTQEFINGYVAGFCSVSTGGSDADQATFDCPQSPVPAPVQQQQQTQTQQQKQVCIAIVCKNIQSGTQDQQSNQGITGGN